jgi:hypothetical protein
MHQQRIRIQADHRRLTIKNRPVGRTRKSKHTDTDANQFHRVYSPVIAMLAEIALTQKLPNLDSTNTQPNPISP